MFAMALFSITMLAVCEGEADAARPARLTSRDRSGWERFAEQTMSVAGQKLERSFGLRRLAGDMRFSFFRSPNGQRYLEWQSLIAGADALPPAFYLPFPSSLPSSRGCDENVSDPVFVYRGFEPEIFQYGHLWGDQLPMLLWFHQHHEGRMAVQMDIAHVVKSFMEWLDPGLARRLLYVPAGSIVCAPELLLLEPGEEVRRPEHLRISALTMGMHRFVLQAHPRQGTFASVIFYRRTAEHSHGRLLDEEQMAALASVAMRRLQFHNRSEELVLFDGNLSFAEQHRLFSTARLVFGPHGAGFANIVWMSEALQPSVVELMCSVNALDVRGCFVHQLHEHKPRPMSFWRLFGSAPWVKYFIVWMSPRDDHPSDYLRVDLDGFDLAMDQALHEDPII